MWRGVWRDLRAVVKNAPEHCNSSYRKQHNSFFPLVYFISAMCATFFVLFFGAGNKGLNKCEDKTCKWSFNFFFSLVPGSVCVCVWATGELMCSLSWGESVGPFQMIGSCSNIVQEKKLHIVLCTHFPPKSTKFLSWYIYMLKTLVLVLWCPVLVLSTLKKKRHPATLIC